MLDLSVKQNDRAFNVLAVSVIGTIAEEAVLGSGASETTVLVAVPHAQIQNVPGLPPLKFEPLPPALRDLQGAFHLADGASANPTDFSGPACSDSGCPRHPAAAEGLLRPECCKESGAAAPYLHNGSVPTLAELLKPASQRVKEFKIGPAYDIVNVGLAVEQPQSGSTLVTTDCSNLNSGNSNCGPSTGPS